MTELVPDLDAALGAALRAALRAERRVTELTRQVDCVERRCRRMSEAHARYQRFLAGGSLRDLVEQLSSELGGPVVVQNPNFLIIEASAADGRALGLSPGKRAADGFLVERAFTERAPVRADDGDGRCVGALTGATGLVGYVTAAPAVRMREEAVAILGDCLGLISYQLTVPAADSRSLELLRGQLLQDLLAGHVRDGLGTRSAQLGHDLAAPHLCIAFGAAQHAELDLARLAQTVLDVGRTVATAPSTPLVGVHEDKVFAFIPGPVTSGGEAVARRVLAEFHDGQDLLIGIGPDCLSPADFAAAARDVAWAVDVLKHRGAKAAVVHSSDLGVFGLLFDHGRANALSDYVARWLGPLQAYDLRHRCELVQTLGEFFKHNSLVATADALHVHVSTLKYRLKRIQTILDADLADHDTAFNLSLAIRLREGLDNLTAPAP